MGIPDDPAAACVELRALGDHAPAGGAFDVVVDALEHRREGVQVCAAQVLGRWRRHEAVAPLLRWLGQMQARHPGQGVVWQAAHALAACVDATDSDWILDSYFAHPPVSRGRYLIKLVTALPDQSLRQRLEKELRSEHAAVRTAALNAAYASHLEDKAALIASLQHDPHETNAHLAGVYLRLLNAGGSRP
jgi:HEAT repeat protein